MSDQFIVRDLRASDVPRIFSDWLKSYRRERELRNVSNPVFFHWQHKAVESLLTDSTVAWAILVDAANPEFVVGWACAQTFEGGAILLHYVYVAQTFRRLGLASRLLATLGAPKDAGLMTTAHTFGGTALLRSRGNEPVYNPFLLFGRLSVPVSTVAPRTEVAKAILKSAKAHRRGFPIDETPAERDAK